MNSYKITLRFYSRIPVVKYIMAENHAKAFELAHGFITPAMGCCEIIPERVRKADVPEYSEPKVDYEEEARIYSEAVGIYQDFGVVGTVLTYWSLYEDGFWKVEKDLFFGDVKRSLEIPWQKGDKIPEFLIGEQGGTLYNYFCG